MVDLTILIAVIVTASLCTWAWMKAARITDDQDERTAKRLLMQMESWRSRKGDV